MNKLTLDINKLDFKKFPGGELHLTSKWYDELSLDDTIDSVICRIQNSDDLMKLLLFVNAYRACYVKLPRQLTIPYFPYARQDRIPKYGEALSVKVIAQIINSLGFDLVQIYDPHSDVTTALIDEVVPVSQWKLWGNYLQENFEKVDLISPDAGALKKIYNLQKELNSKCDNIRIGMKHRDTETGQITHTTVDGNPKNDIALVVDDICDGGRTFVELGKVIREQYKSVILVITHGIFSNGFDELLKYFDSIYTTDSWGTPNIPEEYKEKIVVREIS